MAFNQHQLIPKPDIKVGFRLNDEYADTLLPRIRNLLRSNSNTKRFPGTQPVDFELCHFDLLESEEYFVRDKTDGKRYIMFFTAKDGGTVFMLDESNKFRFLTNFKLPLRHNPNAIHDETMMDGEIVMEIDDNKKCLRYLIFDLMVLNGSILIERPYNKRMGMLKQDVIEPLNAALKRNPELEKRMPFTMEIKSMELSYGLINTLQKIPSLKYGNDGLIFVPVNHPYEPDICHKLLLWKPINQMFVSFKIKIIKPSRDKKPIYQLLIANDDNTHKFYDYFTPDPQTEVDWIKNVHDGDIGQFWYDEHWSTTIYDADPHIRHNGGWRFRRFKRGQHTADSEGVLTEVLNRIQNAVPRDVLEERVTVIREKWKLRQSNRVSGSQPLPTSLTQTSLIQNSSSESLHPPQDSYQPSIQHHDVHEGSESPKEYQDSTYPPHDSQFCSSPLEKRSPVIENRSLNENREILSSPLLLHDRHREPLQKQPLTDTNEHFDPDADPWDAPDYYESSQIVNNESSFPEDQSEYWEENEHLESSESSEAALDNNFLIEKIHESEVQSQTQKPQQYQLSISPNHQFINYTQISSTSSRPTPQKRKSKE
ncbi:8940_t:CDS:10 [Dentiscutata erythropus]|uniref:8940_t:CDS:1 n=1 Tax=Dentiscutata erythropus TaxID=1348616 RepID=A0A9N9AU75_9GLOM|nr:8940_t:CDS:10 [Dentiscutata erythropus]